MGTEILITFSLVNYFECQIQKCMSFVDPLVSHILVKKCDVPATRFNAFYPSLIDTVLLKSRAN